MTNPPITAALLILVVIYWFYLAITLERGQLGHTPGDNTPTKKIKFTSEELDLCKFYLLLEYIRRKVGGHAVSGYN